MEDESVEKWQTFINHEVVEINQRLQTASNQVTQMKEAEEISSQTHKIEILTNALKV